MSSQDPNKITFPEDLPPVRTVVEIPPALRYIYSLFYKSGSALSLIYFILIFIIQPLLELQYSRRTEFTSYVLKKARALLVTLSHKQKVPTVAIKRGDKLYSDAQVQTETNEVKLSDPPRRSSSVSFEDDYIADSTNLIKTKLESLRETLDGYAKYHIAIDQINPFSFQVKKFQGSLDAYKGATLFKTGRVMSGHSSGTDIKNEIRTIKGWFLSGQV